MVSTTDQFVCTRFADSIQSLIQTFDRRGISKWIIDLRKNTGGNCWPMLTGVGPLLGNGVHHGRSVCVALLADGSMLVTDDVSNTIWRISAKK
ncbi:MAG: S41 family peptidase [Flavisolibacter sp.]